MRRRAPPDESATVPNARPLLDGEPEQPAEDVFASFLQRAYARKDAPVRAGTATEWERSVENLLPHEPEPARGAAAEPAADAGRDPESTLRVVLLTNRKTLPPGYDSPRDDGDPEPSSEHAEVTTAVANAEELRAAVRASRPEVKLPADRSQPKETKWSSVVPPPSEATQRREAKKLVPDLAAKKPKPSPAREASEDGLIPSGELDGKLGDMSVLLRYGHEADVGRELEGLRRRYPQDLLLLRRIGEFWSECGRKERALEILFALASGLFERRNVEGMRQALEQAKALDPTSERASRLLALLDARPDAPKK